MEEKNEMEQPIQQLIGEAIGEASVCWTESPRGVFESEKAVAIVDRIMARINTPAFALEVLKNRMQDPDPGEYRYAWQCNIAMAFKDHWSYNPKKEEESEGEYMHRLANGAAVAFLEQLFPLNEVEEDMPGMMYIAKLHSEKKK